MNAQERLAVELANMKSMMRVNSEFRIEMSFAMNLSGGPTQITGQLFVRTLWEGRQNPSWRKVGPFVTTPENTKSSVLAFFAHLADEEPHDGAEELAHARTGESEQAIRNEVPHPE